MVFDIGKPLFINKCLELRFYIIEWEWTLELMNNSSEDIVYLDGGGRQSLITQFNLDCEQPSTAIEILDYVINDLSCNYALVDTEMVPKNWTGC